MLPTVNLSAVPGYTTLEKIGEGGMGEVFKARRADCGQLVALKFVSPFPGGDGEDLRRRLEREAHIVASLAHPNLVRVFGHGAVGGRPYFVMEYVEGGSLRALLEAGAIPVAQARVLLDELAEALVYLHGRGVIHRDLKPENVLLGDGGRVKVTDFGIAVPQGEAGLLTGTGQVLGTVEYMAPEQRARLPVDARADQFALAVVAYEMLTGRRPLGSFKRASELNPRLGAGVDAVLARALEEDPDDRYLDVRAFADALDRALAERPRRRRRLALVSGLAACVAVTVGVAAPALGPFGNNSPENTPPPAPQPATKPAPVRAAEIAEWVKRAERHEAKHERQDAIVCYTEAIALAPRDPLLRVRRADSYLLNGQYQKALDDLEEALRLDANCAAAYRSRGGLYLERQERDLALADLNMALALEPRDAAALTHRGRLHRLQGSLKDALRDFDAALALDRDHGMAYFYRGHVWKSKQEYGRALADYRESVRCTPDNPFAHLALSGLLATCKDVGLRDGKLAVAHATRACELTEWKLVAPLRALATACAECGDLAAAVRWCERALELAATGKDRRSLEQQLTFYRNRLAKLQKGVGG